MWWFNKQKEKDPRANYDFTKEDRDFSTVIRRKNQELKLKEQELEHQIRMKELQMQLEELDYQLNGDEEPNSSGSNPDMMLMSLFSQILNKQPTQVSSTAPLSNSVPEQISLTDDELMEMWNAVPKQYRLATKVMSDEKIKGFIKQQIPRANDDTINRAIAIVKA